MSKRDGCCKNDPTQRNHKPNPRLPRPFKKMLDLVFVCFCSVKSLVDSGITSLRIPQHPPTMAVFPTFRNRHHFAPAPVSSATDVYGKHFICITNMASTSMILSESVGLWLPVHRRTNLSRTRAPSSSTVCHGPSSAKRLTSRRCTRTGPCGTLTKRTKQGGWEARTNPCDMRAGRPAAFSFLL